ncbi:scopoletin glucosyltransferase-like [Zingiber officinale]|uniref:scopoletin glucosyltransferase-like n=1 Tax=Zingiber officinale TaxID=94328 RepID=UPI001C4D59F0|nr:scopoletin glucosyltransferase-like [Zingiber officinale]
MGHLIPMLHLARLFAGRRGVRATVVAPSTAISLIHPTLHHPIQLLPLGELALITHPQNNAITPEMAAEIDRLEVPFLQLLRDHSTDCIVADLFYPWASSVAEELGIPSVLFSGSSCFSSVILKTLGQLVAHPIRHTRNARRDGILGSAPEFSANSPRSPELTQVATPLRAGHTDERNNANKDPNWRNAMAIEFDALLRNGTWNLVPRTPSMNVVGSKWPFLLPGLPDEIHLARPQLPDFVTHPSDFAKRALANGEKRYGMIVNTFDDLERDYIAHAKKSDGGRIWCVGPLSLSQPKEATFNFSDELMQWLDSKKHTNSVLYLCFGSLGLLVAAQLREIALGLQASGVEFI